MTKFVGTSLRGFDFNTPADEAFSARVHADSVPRIRIDAGGRITWGSGSGAGDTNLYRDGSDTLTTDDVFVATGGLVTITSDGAPTESLPDGAIAVDSTNNEFYFRSNGEWTLGGGGNASLTISDSPPTEDVSAGDLWFESDTGKTFVYYDSFWVEIGNSGYGNVNGIVNYLAFPSDIIPQTTNTYSLGSPTHKWQEVYVGPSSLYIEDAETGENVEFTVNDGYLNLDGEPISASIAANSVALGTHTTGSYVQSLVAGTGVTLSNNSGEGATPTIAIGQAVGTTSNVTFNDVTVSGDLFVSGTTTTINAANLNIADNIITLNSDVTSGSPSQNAGIEVLRGSSPTVAMRWNETSDKWEFTTDGSSYSQIAAIGDIALGTDTSGNYVGSVSAGTGISVSNTGVEGGTFTVTNAGVTSVNGSTGAITGVVTTSDTGTITSAMIADGTVVNADINASAAIALSKLASGTSGQVVIANGSGVPTYTTLSGDVTVSNTGVVTIAADSVALGTDTTGNYMSNISAGTGISVSHTQGEGSTATVSLNANLDNLTDVTVSSAADKQLLVYDSATSQWKNADPITSTGIAYKSGVPASKTATGTLGQFSIDGVNGVLYVCTGTNSWQKVSLNSATFTNAGGFS